MKPLSVEMACLLGIQNEIQAVCTVYSWVSFWFCSSFVSFLKSFHRFFFHKFNVVCLNLTDSMNKNAIRFLCTSSWVWFHLWWKETELLRCQMDRNVHKASFQKVKEVMTKCKIKLRRHFSVILMWRLQAADQSPNRSFPRAFCVFELCRP